MGRTYGVPAPLSCETVFKNVFILSCYFRCTAVYFRLTSNDFLLSLTGEFHNDPYANDDHGWGYNGYTATRLDDQFFLGKDILVAPIVNPG